MRAVGSIASRHCAGVSGFPLFDISQRHAFRANDTGHVAAVRDAVPEAPGAMIVLS